MSKFVKLYHDLPPSIREYPLFPFVPKIKKVDEDSVEAYETELIMFDSFVDPENPVSIYSKEKSFLSMEYLRNRSSWLMGIRHTETSIRLKKSIEKIKILLTLLKVRVLLILSIL
jgi:hypothetical protein